MTVKTEEQQKKEKLDGLRRRFENAKKRAKYWSGLPSFTIGGGNSMSRSARQRLAEKGSNHELQYELAITDVQVIADEIKRICGVSPKVTQYKDQLVSFGLLVATTSKTTA